MGIIMKNISIFNKHIKFSGVTVVKNKMEMKIVTNYVSFPIFTFNLLVEVCRQPMSIQCTTGLTV